MYPNKQGNISKNHMAVETAHKKNPQIKFNKNAVFLSKKYVKFKHPYSNYNKFVLRYNCTSDQFLR